MSDWRDRAACLGEDPELFFSPSDHYQWHAQVQAAKAVCAACPVAAQCLEFAFTARLDHGVFGGVTGPEREKLRRRGRRTVRRAHKRTAYSLGRR